MDGLDEVVAQSLRKHLAEIGLRQADLAAGLATLGFEWTPNRVAQVVTGRRSLSLLETAGVCEVLGTSVAGLLGQAGNVLLPAGNEVSVENLGRALRDGESDWTPERDETLIRATKLAAHQAWAAEARQAYAEVHAKAARRLGITEADLEAAALRLWGRSLGLERDTRADASTGVGGDREVQERRRVASRQLLKELRQHLSSAAGDSVDSVDSAATGTEGAEA